MREWRLLDTGFLSGAQNMALDDTLLECHSQGLSPNTVRFLQFRPSVALVGYHQSVEQEIRVDYCKRSGVDINRRITGGGTVLFTPKCLGWEIYADKRTPAVKSFGRDLDRLSRMVCSATVKGLRSLGLEAEFRPRNDIEVHGRKISGTGGTERGESFMYQGTLLIDFDLELMLKSLRIPMEKLKDKEIESAKERVTWIARELGRVPPIEDIKSAIAEGFEKTFDMTLVPGELLDAEKAIYTKSLPYFESDDWVHLVHRSEGTAGHVNAVHKTPGGLIRVSLAIDVAGGFIVSSFITGDFQVFPQRAIMDLEAHLKNLSTDENTIRAEVRGFFEQTGAEIAGVTPDTLADVIIEAVEKKAFVQLGLTLEETNHLMSVNFSPDQLTAQHFDYVLLPYCAKLVGCQYRKTEGCTTCGNCTVGEIYELIESMGVPVRTIQTFEHLIETIEEFKEKGARGFVGSCCEAFFCKHHEDFVASGVPALLIDVDDSTCYELGKEKEAYIGSFEGQTLLKTELMTRVLTTLAQMGLLRGQRP
ncbi:MAG: DUF116 domain-containing protein [Candidatus Thorarchaeota archaeon]|nr:DUF116 domain-containing protein [Candidatus Thorarchaeota archaeon]